ncbi:MAG: type II toxin-antitoxin system prevent-host-death family antitoxin [Planctomycetes bacterium]|nr:type II toxin-antitoxin system prevent-host-death family antitoxin [Planctomycetota bacterium]
MKTMTARDLKNRTGDAIRAVRNGEPVLITFRGRPLATMQPCAAAPGRAGGDRPMAEAWQEIEAALRATRPRFRTWQEAEDAARGRP